MRRLSAGEVNPSGLPTAPGLADSEAVGVATRAAPDGITHEAEMVVVAVRLTIMNGACSPVDQTTTLGLGHPLAVS